MSYRLTDFGVQRIADSANIPNDERNRDWQEYQEWLKAGNTPDPLVVNQEDADRLERRRQMRAAQLGDSLQNMSPAQAAQWVETNVTNLTEAKRVLKALAAIVCVLVKEI